MTRIDLHPASGPEAEAIWPAVKAAHLFADRESFMCAREAAPWRVRVDARARAAVVERWRPHLDIMAIQGLWAAGRDTPAVVEGLRVVARTQGFARLLSPLVPEDAARPYRVAGMEVTATIVASRVSGAAVTDCAALPPQGTRIRTAHAEDLDPLLEIDRACFEPFWAYGRERIERALARERIAVAESADGLIGYTLCTVERGSGTLGRLGVVPEAREAGVGAALLCDALKHMARTGASTISLCTQIENARSRSLYARFGLRELPGRLQLLIGEA